MRCLSFTLLLTVLLSPPLMGMMPGSLVFVHVKGAEGKGGLREALPQMPELDMAAGSEGRQRLDRALEIWTAPGRIYFGPSDTDDEPFATDDFGKNIPKFKDPVKND